MISIVRIIFITTSLLNLTLAYVKCSDPNCNNCQFSGTITIDGTFDKNQYSICVSCNPQWTLGPTACTRPSCKIQYCSSCDSTQTYCTGCNTPYALGTNTCDIQQYIIVIPIFLFIMICITGCVVFCCIRCKRARERRLRQNANQLYQFRNRNIVNQLGSRPPVQLVRPQIQNPNRKKSQKSIQKINSQLQLNPEPKNFEFDYEKDNCTICLEQNCNLITRCNHYFHPQCLYGWMKKNKSCPMCNSDKIRVVNIVICSSCRKLYKQYDLEDPLFLQKLKGVTKKECDLCEIILFEQEEEQSQKNTKKK